MYLCLWHTSLSYFVLIGQSPRSAVKNVSITTLHSIIDRCFAPVESFISRNVIIYTQINISCTCIDLFSKQPCNAHNNVPSDSHYHRINHLSWSPWQGVFYNNDAWIIWMNIWHKCHRSGHIYEIFLCKFSAIIYIKMALACSYYGGLGSITSKMLINYC